MYRTSQYLVIILVSLVLVLGASIAIYAIPDSQANISTVAGTGTSGYSGDGELSILAELNFPFSMATDDTGNLYIADTANHRIRKVMRPSGIITTLAGTGNDGYNGDNQLATSADLNRPIGIAVDDVGNLYIADTFNHRIRKVITTSGIITTVAGTGNPGYNGDSQPAFTAELDRPFDIAVDVMGNLYIADAGNHRIRKVTAANGVITTVAGMGNPGYNGDNQLATDAQLNFPFGITVDGVDNLYVADHDNHRIRKVIVSSGIITTVAGTGTPGYNGDNQLAIDAQLNFPFRTAIDEMDNLYIAEEGNHRIRKVIAESGIITTIAGTGTPGYNGDNKLANTAQINSPTGVIATVYNLYIVDRDNHRIRELTCCKLYLPLIFKS